MNALSLSRRRHGARLCRRACGSRGAPCALHRRRRDAHRARTICASCASSASTPVTAKAHPDADGLHAAIVARAGLDAIVARARAHGADEAAARAARGAGARRDGGGGPARARCSAACRISRASPTWRRSRPRCGLAPDATRRLGALGAWIAEDAERLWQRLRLSNAEHERLAAMATDWWRVSPAMGEAAARVLIYRLGAGAFHRARAARLGALGGERARRSLARSRDLAATLDRAGVSAARGGFHRARRREGSGARRGARPAPRKPGSRRVSDGAASARRDRRRTGG